ncbi:MAG: DUF6445 family protein [Dokdonella sp.]
MQPVAVFNPRPQIERITLDNGAFVYVVDDALLQPERYVEWAAVNADAFRPVDFNAYPGNFLLLPDPIDEALRQYFIQHMRGLFDARRLEQMHCRLSMVTLQPQVLRPYQWLCHSDRYELDAARSIQASVLYLFKDASFGGTSFYVPTRTPAETARLFADSSALSSGAFTQRYGIQPGYLHASNDYFTQIGNVPARWNRLIFYDGSLLHSGSIAAPEKLTADPRTGRLTFNGFFICRRNAS